MDLETYLRGRYAVFTRIEKENFMSSENINTAVISKLQSLKGFDLSDLLDAFSDEPQDLVDLLLGFKTRHEKIFDEIKLNLDENNMTHAKELVHKLKGTAGNIGAVKLAEAATTLDAELRSNQVKPETLTKLEDAFNSTMTSLLALN